MIKKAIILILTAHVITILQSCCTDEFNYKWKGFNIDLIDNSGIDPRISENNVINKKALGMRITMADTIYQIAQSKIFNNSCYATSCGEKYIRVHDIRSLIIRTLNDYSPDYLSDSEITHLFKARIIENTRQDYIPIDEMLTLINQNNTYSVFKTFDIYLMDTTCIAGPQKFEIVFNLSDGNRLINQTNFTLTN